MLTWTKMSLALSSCPCLFWKNSLLPIWKPFQAQVFYSASLCSALPLLLKVSVFVRKINFRNQNHGSESTLFSQNIYTYITSSHFPGFVQVHLLHKLYGKRVLEMSPARGELHMVNMVIAMYSNFHFHFPILHPLTSNSTFVPKTLEVSSGAAQHIGD